ncbi:hypothetical protein ABZ942_40775 [Nocardia sp. NPDC046473]|uniref:hypothetical protein n=1 Tax=Nocardia sp. NPDC046473 TaxID=3155733 RepID=UPI0033C54B05
MSTDETPDFALSLATEYGAAAVTEVTPAAPPDERDAVRRYADELAADITELLVPAGPPRWQRLYLTCSATVAAVTGDAVFVTETGDSVAVAVPATATELIQLLRTVTVALADRAWWLVELRRDRGGSTVTEFGYGDLPFPPSLLQPAAAYRADLERFPRERLPVWLAAYLAVEDGRTRLSELLTRAHLDSETPAIPVEFLEPRLMWARWAIVAAAAVAAESDWGPRVIGSAAAFESTDGSGSTLHLLPRGRAVLSGGVWDAPELDAAYNDGAPMPEYYGGLPDWVDAPVLNHRAVAGLLSFCYWWDGTGWYRGQSPGPAGIGAAIPGMWTPETVTGIVCAVLGDAASRSAVADLVAAAESGAVSRDTVRAAFGGADRTAAAAGFTQLALAGLTR